MWHTGLLESLAPALTALNTHTSSSRNGTGASISKQWPPQAAAPQLGQNMYNNNAAK